MKSMPYYDMLFIKQTVYIYQGTIRTQCSSPGAMVSYHNSISYKLQTSQFENLKIFIHHTMVAYITQKKKLN